MNKNIDRKETIESLKTAKDFVESNIRELTEITQKKDNKYYTELSSILSVQQFILHAINRGIEELEK